MRYEEFKNKVVSMSNETIAFNAGVSIAYHGEGYDEKILHVINLITKEKLGILTESSYNYYINTTKDKYGDILTHDDIDYVFSELELDVKNLKNVAKRIEECIN